MTTTNALRLGVRGSRPALATPESGRGLPHSTTWRKHIHPMKTLLTLLLLSWGLTVPAATVSNPPPVVTLAWDASLDPSVTGYTVYQSTNSFLTRGLSSAQARFSVPNTLTNALEVKITNLIRGVTHYWVVTASNASGLESDPSNEASYTVPAPPPPPGRLRVTVQVALQSAGDASGPWVDLWTLPGWTADLAGDTAQFYRAVLTVNAEPPQ
jgi:hypothetical protein